MRKPNRRATDRGKDKSALQENSQGQLAALGSRWQEAGVVYLPGGSLKKGEKYGGDNRQPEAVVKAQGRKKGGGEERKEKEKMKNK